ncbi:MAG: putative sulfate/molybdate transporter [Candidatus Thiodiazotropha sp.]
MNPLQRHAGDLSGAFADLGTFLPIVLGVLALGQMDPAGVFIGFGLFSLAVALVYRRPVPVQPMKVVGAVAIAGQLDAASLAATGALLGIVLLILAATGIISRLSRRIPVPVLSGVQLGIGLYLVWGGFRLFGDAWIIGVTALLLLILLRQTRLRAFTVLIVVVGISCWRFLSGEVAFPVLHPGLHLPPLTGFGVQDLALSATTLLLPQLALTLTNATVITAAIAAEVFPQDRERITPDRLALSTGALNLLLAPLGAFPMCHGAGGLVVQHRFGARTGLAPALFGLSCLSLGLFLGEDALKLLALLPLSAVGALLVYAGAQLAVSRKLLRLTRWELAVVLVTGLCCVAFNVAVGLLAGLLLSLFLPSASKSGPE